MSAVRDLGGAAQGEWEPSRTLVGAVLTFAAASYVSLGGVAAWPHVARVDSDFVNYFQAAKAVVEGRSPFSVPGFDYPPLLALLVLPLVPLGLVGARWAWFILGHGCLLASAWLLWGRLGGGRAALLAVALVWGVGGTIAENLALGQVNPLLLVLVVASLPVGRGGGGTSLWIGAATAVKLWPGVLVLRDAALGRMRSSALAALVAVGLVVGPLLGVAVLLPPPAAPPHARYWMGTPALYNFSIPAVALRFLDPPTPASALPPSWVVGNDPGQLVLPTAHRVVSVAVALAGLGIGLVALLGLVRKRGATRTDPLLLTGALVALALACAPICWYHYRLLHFVGAATICSVAMRRRRWGVAGAALTVLVVATWTAPVIDRGYVAAYGWTAAAPGTLWLLASIVPLADLVLGSLCLLAPGNARDRHGAAGFDVG